MTHKQNLADAIWLTCPKCLNLFAVASLDWLTLACPLDGGMPDGDGIPTFGCREVLTKEEWKEHITPVKFVDVDRSEGK
jgi:hypothetical protein